jgi:MFS transporter, DHA2 family, multidrug resistance protein
VAVIPRHAIIGIAAVCLAAANSSLGAGLISAGLEDLRGVWGLGIDDAAYFPTAFNAAQMFMGPLSVMLAARYGHRTILLIAACVYTLTSLFIPLVPPTVPIIILLVIGGLASGTFYPLCLSFISRNLPVTLVTYGVAAYSLDLLGTNHVDYAMEGFFMNHMGWQWIFWNQGVLCIPMLLLIYYGIPPTPKEALVPKFNYVGIIYMSLSLSLFFIALDQGERLDWYNNGLVNGLLIAGTLLFIMTFVRRRVLPNPYLDFSYLKTRNLLILGFLFVTFRTNLLRVGLIVPQFLERLHQYRPEDTGNLLILSFIPFLIALPIVATLLKRMPVRVILGSGFLILALINFHDSHALSTWIGADFVTTQLIGSIAICMVAMATVSGVIFEGRMTGAYRVRAGAYTQGAFFQCIRLFGAESTVSGLRRFILYRAHFWQTKLTSGLPTFGQFDNRVSYLSTNLAPQASGIPDAHNIATGLTNQNLQNEAFTLATDDSFMMLAWVCAVSLLGVALLKRVPLPHELPAADAPPPPAPDPSKKVGA